MRTPEAKVKAYAGKRWKQLGAYAFMYVPFGYGQPTLDYLVCLNGRFIGAEAKAPGKEPTPRQYACMEQIKAAGGVSFWFDSPETFEMALKENGLLPTGQLEPAATELH